MWKKGKDRERKRKQDKRRERIILPTYKIPL